jgi:hypothetical protein
MNELESFFSSIASRDRQEEQFFNDLLFLAVHEWHITPKELMDIDIPILYILLDKQRSYNQDQEQAFKRR